MLTIKKIMYKPPATIVFWNDGTKTVSVCEKGDVYNTESGVWGPVTVPKLDADVAIAERDANHKLSDLRVYPVIKLGVVYRF